MGETGKISEKRKEVKEKRKAEEEEKDEKATREEIEQLDTDEAKEGEKKLNTEPIKVQGLANDDGNKGDTVSDKKTDNNVEDVPDQGTQPGVEDSKKKEDHQGIVKLMVPRSMKPNRTGLTSSRPCQTRLRQLMS